MAMTVAELVVKLSVEARGFSSELKRAGGEVERLGTKTAKAGTAMTTMGRGLLPLSAAIAGAGFAVAKAAVNFESGLVGVAKTTDLTGDSLKAFGQEVRNMSKEIPVGTTELLGIAEAAGQLGVKEENLLKFTETMAALGRTTNLSSADAAKALARFNNIFDESNDNVDVLGSIIVDLGNNFATTEAEIVTMATRLAGAGKVAGLTQGEVLALATAMSSVGIQAELGGSAMSRVLLEMQKELQLGGEKAEAFARIAGTSVDELARVMSTDAIGALQMVIDGLGRMQAEGENVSEALDNVGLDGVRVSRMLLSLSGAGDLTAEAIARMTEAQKNNSALQVEVEKRYASSAAQFEIFKNRVMDIAISLGEGLVPALLAVLDVVEPLLDGVKWVAEAFAAAPKPIQAVVVVMGAMVAVAGPLLLAMGMFVQGLAAITATGLITAGALTAVTGGLILIPALAVGAAFAINELGEAKRRASERAEELASAMEAAGGATHKAVESGIQAMDVYTEAADAIEKTGTSMRELRTVMEEGHDGWENMQKIASDMGTTTIEQTLAIGRLRAEADQMSPSAHALADRFIGLYESGKLTREELERLFNLLDEGGDAFDDVKESTIAAQQEWIQAEIYAGNMTHAMGRWRAEMLNDATTLAMLEAAVAVIRGQATGLGVDFVDLANDMGWAAAAQVDYKNQTEAAAAMTQAMKDEVVGLSEQMREMAGASEVASRAQEIAEERTRHFAMVAAVTAGESADSWEDFAEDVVMSFDDYKAALEESIQAALDFNSNISTVFGKLGPELQSDASLGALRKLPPEILAEMATLSGPKLDEFMTLVLTAASLTADGFGENLDNGLAPVPGQVAAVGNDIVAGLENSMYAGQGRVYLAGYALGEIAVQSVKTGAIVSSPSKATIEIGQWVYKGLIVGMEEGHATVAEAGRFLAEAGLEGIVEGFEGLDDAVGALQDRIAQIEWENETRKLEEQRQALEDMRTELQELKLAYGDAVQAVADAYSEQTRKALELEAAEQRLVDAKREAALVTQDELQAIRLANEAMEDAEQKVSDLTFELNLLADSQRDMSDLTLASELGIARAAVSLDRQADKVSKLEKELGKLKEGSDAYARKQRELRVATLEYDLALEDQARAQHEAITVNDAVSETMEDLAIAQHDAEKATDDYAQAQKDALDPTIGIEEAVRDVEEAEKAYEAAVQDTIDKQKLAEAADEKVIAKKKAIEVAERELELATLKFALKWMMHMQDMATETEKGAARSTAASGGNRRAIEADVSAINAVYRALPDEVITSAKFTWNSAKGALVAWTSELRNRSSAAQTNFNDAIKSATAEFAPKPLPIPTTRTVTPPRRVGGGGGTATQHLGGGFVPGMVGQSMPITAHGGEFVIPADVVRAIQNGATNGAGISSGGGGGVVAGDTIIVNVHGKATRDDGQKVVEALRQYQRRRGAIPIDVKGL